MKKKRAAELGFKCSCKGPIEKVGGTDYGCTNPECFHNFHQMAYRVKLGLIPKNRL